MIIAYNRYAETNIPLDYWDLEMKDFQGAKELKNAYDKIIENLPLMYNSGSSFCFAGTTGTGKTMTSTNILKRACEKGYACQYTTLNEIINVLINAPNEEKYIARKELMLVDYLCVDEFDSKYIADGAADLYGRLIEDIFRSRQHNKLPTIFCTNSPSPMEMFKGAIKQSIESLFHRVRIIPVLAEDYRKKRGANDA